MATNYKDLLAQETSELRDAVEARAAEIIAEHVTLKQLRQKLGHTQTDMAERTGKKQPTIAALESAKDPRLSSIATYLSAMDCDFEIIGRYPDGQRFQIELN